VSQVDTTSEWSATWRIGPAESGNTRKDGLQRLLLEELQHRIKNVLATVMAIASQSLINADSVEHAREAIEHRLLALGRVHDLLFDRAAGHGTTASVRQGPPSPV
jgi:two-component sensor histidine kinase